MTSKTSRIVFVAVLVMAFTISAVNADWETRTVNSPFDDGIITETGGKFFDSPWVSLKEPTINHNAYFAFRNIELNQSAKIENAYLQVSAPFPWNFNQSLPVTVYGLKTTGDLDSWNPTPDLNSFPQTLAFTNFDADPLVSSAVINITVTDIISEIYNQANWIGGNDIAIRISSVGQAGGSRWATAYDSDPTRATKLFIEWAAENDTSTYYKGFTITNNSKIEQLVYYYYHDGLDETFLSTWDTNGNRLTNFTQGTLGANQWEEGDATNWFSFGSDIYAVNKTGYFVKSPDGGNTWLNVGLVLNETIDGGQGFTWDAINEVIHGVFKRNNDVYYFNFTLDGSVFGATTQLYSSGTWGEADWISVDINDENEDTDIIIGLATQDGGSSDIGSLFIRRNEGVWTSDPQTWNFVTPRHVAVRYRDDGDITLVVDADDDSGHTDGGAIIFDLGHNQNLTEIPNYLDAAWLRFPGAGVLGDRSGAPWSSIDIDGGIHTIYRTDFNSTATYYLPVAYRIHYPYSLTNYAPYPQSISQYFNSSDTDWRYNMMRIFTVTTDPLDDTKTVRRWWGIMDQGVGDLYMWDEGLGTDPVQTINIEKKDGSILAARIQVKTQPHQAQSPSISDTVYAIAANTTVRDPNGDLVNSTCLDEAVTLEEIKACIDDITGGDPSDPDPPGTNYPPDGVGALTRFNIRFYIWMMGWVGVFFPLFAMAYKSWSIEYYFYFGVVVIAGVGLLWTIGSI